MSTDLQGLKRTFHYQALYCNMFVDYLDNFGQNWEP